MRPARGRTGAEAGARPRGARGPVGRAQGYFVSEGFGAVLSGRGLGVRGEVRGARSARAPRSAGRSGAHGP